jgi:hypothetical protein
MFPGLARRSLRAVGRAFGANLKPRARLLVAAVWIAGQTVLIATGPRRAGGTFAFRMFPESSTIQIDLSREVVAQSGQGTELVPVEAGRWLARDEDGVLHRFRWDDRVKDGNLFPWGRPVHASYGADAQLERVPRALDDVAAHVPEDAETFRLIADVTVRRNGGPPEHLRFSSRARDVR